jgi:plastocyanin
VRFHARRLRLPFAAALALGLFFASVGSAAEPTIEAHEGGSGFSWNPSSASVITGGTVAFKNSSASVPHGVHWTGGPEKPSCSSGVAVEQEKTSWSGTCTFAQDGTYSFVCTVHPTEMRGTIAVTSTGEPPPVEPPPAESPVRALKLARNQHGGTVRGSLELSPAAAGGKLEVLLSNGRAGRLVRSGLAAGRVSFAVPLKRSMRRTLRSRGKVSLAVRVIVTPPAGTPLTLKRGVTLHV